MPRAVRAASEVASLEPRLLLTANMTDQEQLLLELINRARANPTAEANRYGLGLNDGLAAGTITTSAKQPLAPHQILINIAGAHSQDMLDRDYFNHTTQGTTNGSGERAVAAGYPAPATAVGENIAWGGSTGPIDNNAQVYARHEGLFRSAGHRQNMLHPPYEEAGTGIRYGQFTSSGTTYNAAMVTENFGIRSVNPYITGIVYTDANSDDFYDIGESIRSGSVTATNVNSGTTFTDTIGNSGAYGVIVPAGVYSVRASYSVNGVASSSTRLVTVGSDNVKLDFDTTTPGSLNLTASSTVTSINETGAVTTTTVTVTRNGDTSAALTVTLTSSDTTEATVPSTVVIPAGQTAASFVVTAVNDLVIDGTQTSQITTAAPGYGSGTISISVADRTVPLLPSAEQVVATSLPTFSWTSISNAATYEIWVNNVTTSENKVLNVSGITLTSHTATQHLGIGTYNVWVRGVTAGGLQSIWSPAGIWKLRPTTTVNDSNRTEASSSFTISWNAIPGASSYDVWVDRLTSRTAQYLRNTNVIGTTLSVTNFAIGRYGIWVRGRNLRGDLVNWSPQAIITVNTPVSGLSVNAAALNSTATLNWSATGGATSYDVWVDNLTTGTAQFVRNQSVTTNSLSLPTLTAGSYRAWVRAKDVNGLAYTWSPAFNFEFQRSSRLLSPSSNPGVTRPVFLWTPVSGAVTYELVIADALLTPIITESSLTETTYTPAADLAAGSYRAWITAIDGGGARSAASSMISFTIVGVDPPVAPDDESRSPETLFASLQLLENHSHETIRVLSPMTAAREESISDATVIVDRHGHSDSIESATEEAACQSPGTVEHQQIVHDDDAAAMMLSATWTDFWSVAEQWHEMWC
ncbi:MAG: CAP domain-containing protein [Planctomycetota bacterium]